MTIADGVLNAKPELSNVLSGGYQTLDRDQIVMFRRYTKTVLPVDGYLFWVASGFQFPVRGSLHYATTFKQDFDERIGVNKVKFTTRENIHQFNELEPSSMMIGDWNGLKIAFAARSDYAEEAGIWHYYGDAVYPPLLSQIVDESVDLSAYEPIVSNSLPFWLTLTQFAPVYPAYLAGENVAPPYIIVDVMDQSTAEWQSFPGLNGAFVFQNGQWTLGVPVANQPGFYNPTSEQLCMERVKLTLYGLTNQSSLAFRDYVLNAMNTASPTVGVVSCGAVRDEKRTQAEIGALAMKKSLDLHVSYNQTAVSDLAIRLINQAFFTIGVS